MEKRILIIGNNDGLPGVKVDIQNYKVFFKSSYGGDWYGHEIIEKLNPTRADVLSELDSLKKMALDYLIVIFSGHAGQERETILETNGDGERLAESRLQGLATRQLNIYDCCRAFSQTILEGVKNKLERKTFSTSVTRRKYENRILEAIPQQVSLYACAIGEKAHDTSDGGAYSKNLIQCAISDSNDFTKVGTAHVDAAVLTSAEFTDQHPTADLPRCSSSQQLVIGTRP